MTITGPKPAADLTGLTRDDALARARELAREHTRVRVKAMIAQQSQHKVSAPHVVCQVAEEKTSVWVIAHVLNNDAPIRIPVRFFEFFSGGAGKALQK